MTGCGCDIYGDENGKDHTVLKSKYFTAAQDSVLLHAHPSVEFVLDLMFLRGQNV